MSEIVMVIRYVHFIKQSNKVICACTNV